MLDLNQLMPQLDAVDPGVFGDQSDRVALAREALLEAQGNTEAFEKRLAENELSTNWALSQPLEDFSRLYEVHDNRIVHTVAAIDGSQIMPNRHEILSCYLINLGKVMISYGKELPVVLDSTPLLFHSLDDIFPLLDRRRTHIDESYVGHERTIYELSALRDLALQAQERALPVVAFLDGSLALYALDKTPQSYRNNYLGRFGAILESFRQHKIPLIGYISHSRSADIVNALRVFKCPYARSNCQSLCGHLNEDEFPCSTICPTFDRHVLSQILSPGQRCAIFRTARSNEFSDEQQRCFTYINVGKEIARVEFPRWLADDSALLDQALSVVMSQASKGAGYPVCLTEAHNLAIIRSSDRHSFFELLTRHLVESGAQRLTTSPKEIGKRRSIV